MWHSVTSISDIFMLYYICLWQERRKFQLLKSTQPHKTIPHLLQFGPETHFSPIPIPFSVLPTHIYSIGATDNGPSIVRMWVNSLHLEEDHEVTGRVQTPHWQYQRSGSNPEHWRNGKNRLQHRLWLCISPALIKYKGRIQRKARLCSISLPHTLSPSPHLPFLPSLLHTLSGNYFCLLHLSFYFCFSPFSCLYIIISPNIVYITFTFSSQGFFSFVWMFTAHVSLTFMLMLTSPFFELLYLMNLLHKLIPPIQLSPLLIKIFTADISNQVLISCPYKALAGMRLCMIYGS